MSDPTQEVPEDQPYLDQTTVPEVTGRPMDHKHQPKQTSKGPVPARQGNGYYADHATGDRLRSVTTIIGGGVPKPQLIFWAAGICVDAAIEALPALVLASRSAEKLQELSRWLKRAHTQAKEERGDIGDRVHKIIESKILDQPLPAELLEDEEMAPYLAHFLEFVEEWAVEFTASEMVVANPVDGWAGTLDYMLRSERIVEALRAQGYDVPDGVDLMGDTKTGGTWDRLTSAGHVHGVYPEAGLQMSAYRKAKVAWLRDGSRVPMPATASVGIVLHLRPEGYRIYPALCGDDIYVYFRHAQMVDEFTSRIASAKAKRPVIGKALQMAARAAKAVA
jgi:hypothetical protein